MRRVAASPATIFTSIIILIAILLGAIPARGVEVPFTERLISNSANGALSVFAADMDGDGDIDALSASFDDGKIEWYENDGSSPPSFTERLISDAALVTYSVLATDLDGDGDTDVLSGSYPNVAWYESDGASPPSFVERVISTSVHLPFSVLAADVDNDGDTDVLVGASGQLAWYESDGASPPTFTEFVLWSSSTATSSSVFATDVDGDGDTDLLSASGSNDLIAWYESDGGSPPTFTEKVISMTDSGGRSVFATDLDGDGDTDVLGAQHAWYESDGGSPPTFIKHVIPGGPFPASSVFAADVDGDGDIDLLAASSTSDGITWHDNDGGSPPSFAEHVISTIAEGASSVFAADLDGDGDVDVLSASGVDDQIVWYENTPPPPPVTFGERVISTAADFARSVFATDLDGDGDPDVLSASALDDKIAWYESDGGLPPTLNERVISTTADFAASVFATDLDGDGDTDVLSASQNDNNIAWYESDGGLPPIFTERVISTVANNATAVFAADVDGDGFTDVLSASSDDNKIAWYQSDGGLPPTFTEWVISTTASGASSVFATDVDGDGDTDVLSASRDDDKIAWYQNEGGTPPAFIEWVISDAADRAFSVYATDVDGDGDTDVLSASSFDDKIAWYESDGGSPPSFRERIVSVAVNSPGSVSAADVDGDSDIDVLSASALDDKIAWYESDGGSPPTFTQRVISSLANGASSVFALDMDGDGDIDVLSASGSDDKIAWYESTACGDGVVEGSEVCDDGGESATCDVDCTVAECGDGMVNETAGEACDDGGESTTCDTDCSAAGCGDGTLNATAGEACDDGGESSTCDGDCTFAECGDGTLNATAGEVCDGGLGCTECACTTGFEPNAPLSLDCQPTCGNRVCDLNENPCNCPDDCGAPPLSEVPRTTCADDLDNDCDGLIDSEDADCASVPAISEWGLLVIALGLLVAAKVYYGRGIMLGQTHSDSA